MVATDRLVQCSGAGTVAVTGGNQAAEFIPEEYKEKIIFIIICGTVVLVVVVDAACNGHVIPHPTPPFPLFWN